jgi:copper chaperone
MTKLSIPDMSCGHCKTAVEAALTAVADADRVEVDLATRMARVSGPAPVAELLAALDQAGYPASIAG